MKRAAPFALALWAFVGLATVAQAADPTGTWKWSVTFNDQTRETTLKLKLDGETLSGHVVGRDNAEIKLENATFKNDEVSFSVTRERNGQKRTAKYKGKLDGNVIKGTTESERDGQTRSRDWEAKRE